MPLLDDDPRLRLRLLPTLDGSPSSSRLSSSSSSSLVPREEDELLDEKLIPVGSWVVVLTTAAAAGCTDTTGEVIAAAAVDALGLAGNIPIVGGGAWVTLTDEIGIGLLMMPIPAGLVVVVAGSGDMRKGEGLLLVVAALLLAGDELWRASSSLKNL